MRFITNVFSKIPEVAATMLRRALSSYAGHKNSNRCNTLFSGIVSRADSPKTLKFRLRNPTARYLGPSLRLSPGLPRLARVPRQATLLAKEDLDLGTHKIEELLGCMGLDWAEGCSLAISTSCLESEPQNE